ncbi:hypothetical protein H2248_005271 [Termitomyces sp. 'cryptogamus']|nr:hypothetical protein H2248_005271 [Termitomyces sp. 'cryptogamus']
MLVLIFDHVVRRQYDNYWYGAVSDYLDSLNLSWGMTIGSYLITLQSFEQSSSADSCSCSDQSILTTVMKRIHRLDHYTLPRGPSDHLVQQ